MCASVLCNWLMTQTDEFTRKKTEYLYTGRTTDYEISSRKVPPFDQNYSSSFTKWKPDGKLRIPVDLKKMKYLMRNVKQEFLHSKTSRCWLTARRQETSANWMQVGDTFQSRWMTKNQFSFCRSILNQDHAFQRPRPKQIAGGHSVFLCQNLNPALFTDKWLQSLDIGLGSWLRWHQKTERRVLLHTRIRNEDLQ